MPPGTALGDADRGRVAPDPARPGPWGRPRHHGRWASAGLGPGDLAVVRGELPYTVGDAPGSPPTVVIGAGQSCVAVPGGSGPPMRRTGVRTWGNTDAGGTLLLTGIYQVVGEVGRRLPAALPELAVVRSGERATPLIDLLAAEATGDGPGQDAVLDRLLDLVLVSALRTWFAHPDRAPAWYAAQGDPVVGPALDLIHHEPAHGWTVAALAARAGVSRAVLARRFTTLVGEPPMSYLTGWRVALAADLLRDPTATIAAVARQVGYDSPFAFSTAFKRRQGCSPREYRLRHTDRAPATR